ncbi:MAG TPA: acyl-CoA thioesterase [Spirochaetota bacterium]|nr:acyl-CoA thioesterase [Spirochaetota bacterium]
METFSMVRPEHLNHHGFLFGGQLLLWVDEYAWLAAARDLPGCRLVTRAMDSISFIRSAPVGSILRFDISQTYKGQTSAKYQVSVFCDPQTGAHEYNIFSTNVIFVNVDQNCNKKPFCNDKN